jgi:hypothetical protein
MLDKGYFQLVEQVFTLARVQMINSNPGDKASLAKLLELETDLNSRLEEYNTLKEQKEILQPDNGGSELTIKE